VRIKKAYRRQGFAFLTCAAFIEYCLAHDLEPNWGCWDHTPGSRDLAGKLGFEEISHRTALVLERRRGFSKDLKREKRPIGNLSIEKGGAP